MEVELKKVPKYLKKSGLYKEFDESNGIILVKSERHMKLNPHKFENVSDFESYVMTADFWIYDLYKYISDEAVSFIKKYKNDCLSILYNYYNVSKKIIEEIKTMDNFLKLEIKSSKEKIENNYYLEGIYKSGFGFNDYLSISFLENDSLIYKIEIPFKNYLSIKFKKLHKAIKSNIKIERNIYEFDNYDKSDSCISFKYESGIITFIINKLHNFLYDNMYYSFPLLVHNLNFKITKYNKKNILETLETAVEKMQEYEELNNSDSSSSSEN